MYNKATANKMNDQTNTSAMEKKQLEDMQPDEKHKSNDNSYNSSAPDTSVNQISYQTNNSAMKIVWLADIPADGKRKSVASNDNSNVNALGTSANKTDNKTYISAMEIKRLEDVPNENKQKYVASNNNSNNVNALESVLNKNDNETNISTEEIKRLKDVPPEISFIAVGASISEISVNKISDQTNTSDMETMWLADMPPDDEYKSVASNDNNAHSLQTSIDKMDNQSSISALEIKRLEDIPPDKEQKYVASNVNSNDGNDKETNLSTEEINQLEDLPLDDQHHSVAANDSNSYNSIALEIPIVTVEGHKIAKEREIINDITDNQKINIQDSKRKIFRKMTTGNAVDKITATMETQTKKKIVNAYKNIKSFGKLPEEKLTKRTKKILKRSISIIAEYEAECTKDSEQNMNPQDKTILNNSQLENESPVPSNTNMITTSSTTMTTVNIHQINAEDENNRSIKKPRNEMIANKLQSTEPEQMKKVKQTVTNESKSLLIESTATAYSKNVIARSSAKNKNITRMRKKKIKNAFRFIKKYGNLPEKELKKKVKRTLYEALLTIAEHEAVTTKYLAQDIPKNMNLQETIVNKSQSNELELKQQNQSETDESKSAAPSSPKDIIPMSSITSTTVNIELVNAEDQNTSVMEKPQSEIIANKSLTIEAEQMTVADKSELFIIESLSPSQSEDLIPTCSSARGKRSTDRGIQKIRRIRHAFKVVKNYAKVPEEELNNQTKRKLKRSLRIIADYKSEITKKIAQYVSKNISNGSDKPKEKTIVSKSHATKKIQKKTATKAVKISNKNKIKINDLFDFKFMSKDIRGIENDDSERSKKICKKLCNCKKLALELIEQFGDTPYELMTKDERTSIRWARKFFHRLQANNIQNTDYELNTQNSEQDQQLSDPENKTSDFHPIILKGRYIIFTDFSRATFIPYCVRRLGKIRRGHKTIEKLKNKPIESLKYTARLHLEEAKNILTERDEQFAKESLSVVETPQYWKGESETFRATFLAYKTVKEFGDKPNIQLSEGERSSLKKAKNIIEEYEIKLRNRLARDKEKLALKSRTCSDEQRDLQEHLAKRQKKEYLDSKKFVKHYLFVAVIDKNSTKGISQSNWNLVENTLLKFFENILVTNPAASTQYKDAGWHFGHIKLIACLDQKSKDLYKEAISRVGEIWPSAKLEAIFIGNELPPPSSPIGLVSVTEETSDPMSILSIIKTNNPQLSTSDWKVTDVSAVGNGLNQVVLILNNESIKPLEETKGLINYGFNSIVITIFHHNDLNEDVQSCANVFYDMKEVEDLRQH